jgi:hypothetical protein
MKFNLLIYCNVTTFVLAVCHSRMRNHREHVRKVHMLRKCLTNKLCGKPDQVDSIGNASDLYSGGDRFESRTDTRYSEVLGVNQSYPVWMRVRIPPP